MTLVPKLLVMSTSQGKTILKTMAPKTLPKSWKVTLSNPCFKGSAPTYTSAQVTAQLICAPERRAQAYESTRMPTPKAKATTNLLAGSAAPCAQAAPQPMMTNMHIAKPSTAEGGNSPCWTRATKSLHSYAAGPARAMLLVLVLEYLMSVVKSCSLPPASTSSQTSPSSRLTVASVLGSLVDSVYFAGALPAISTSLRSLPSSRLTVACVLEDGRGFAILSPGPADAASSCASIATPPRSLFKPKRKA
mmetsp:Transcript_7517/g.19006  ORF Transcript_7517/g.19006 Transcript_7517/m.19006 type:complete len:248 (+) Transcript_7517:620-1363(+)